MRGAQARLAAAEASLKESEAARSLVETRLSHAEARGATIPKLEQAMAGLRAQLSEAEKKAGDRASECDR